MSNKITLELAERLINSTHGTIFSVHLRRVNGPSRVLTCRLGVSKGVTGQGLAYNPSDYDLIPVYDMVKCSHRMIRLDALTRISAFGDTFRVIP